MSMPNNSLIKTCFQVPIREDKSLGNGELHHPERWRQLDIHLYSIFGAYTLAPGLYYGPWKDPDTNGRVNDFSRKYIVAIAKENIDKIKQFIRDFIGPMFRQKCIYFEFGGYVELINTNMEMINIYP